MSDWRIPNAARKEFEPPVFITGLPRSEVGEKVGGHAS